MKITSFTVLPNTPQKLKKLNELAYNLYFSWNTDALDIFRKLDPAAWELAQYNPVNMLSLVSQEALDKAEQNKSFQAQIATAYDRYKDYMESSTWFEREHGERKSPVIAYFSAEYGLHVSLPVYSGGLGALSGDHIKSSSDLGIPLVGIGLLYSQGYFRQHLNADGLQQETYPENDWYSEPVCLMRDDNGTPLRCSVKLAGDDVFFNIWRVAVGRVNIYLLDTNIAENKPQHRTITKTLYDPDRDTRIRQEIVLGIGGVRALEKLGFVPEVYHVNEGHSAFLLLERLKVLVKNHGLSLEEAKQVVWSSTLFTTHTPVPAGNETFSYDLMEKYFKDYAAELGFDWQTFLSIGVDPSQKDEKKFSMTVLALNYAAYVNGVARLHGHVSRGMWKGLYPNIPQEDIPIGAVVNGVHASTWLSPLIYNLFLRYGGPGNLSELADFSIWEDVDKVPDEELWTVKVQNRKKMIDFTRRCLVRQHERRGSHSKSFKNVNDILDPAALTIGFARRFATYKRGSLLLKNIERLKQLFNNKERPVQIIIAGKAHPADHAGKEIIKHIFEIANQADFRRRMIFLEDYDLNIASALVQGVDVWLNTPRRPNEACGTSGMKAAINGALNVSILDGWWDEAYTPEVGWAIGGREIYESKEVQDQIESDMLYATLERDVVPMFYERDEKGIPREWIKMMKNSIKVLGVGFNSHRMIRDYVETYYLNAENLHQRLRSDNYKEAKALAEWRSMIVKNWTDISVTKVESHHRDFIFKGKQLEIMAWINLGKIRPDNIIVECVHGPLDTNHQIIGAERSRMKVSGATDDTAVYAATITCSRGGHYGYAVRVLPGHPNLAVNILPNLIKWYE
ncbi:MAG: alpha-glucan family phosphorylase [Deltaproteobacteria bacterium]|nr:alpha-glucan family phosphorylase [Deltaproteobacteria bacterium]